MTQDPICGMTVAAAVVQVAKDQSLPLEAVKDFHSVTGGGVARNAAGHR